MAYDYVKTLTCLGLTPNQAKIYVALAKSGSATIREASKASMLARETIYRAMPSLENMGIIERRLTDPITFEAISPRKAVALLFRRQMLKSQQLEKEMLELAKSLEDAMLLKAQQRTQTQEESKPTLMLLTGQEALSRNIIASVRRAKESFEAISTPQHFRTIILEASRPLNEAMSRGVRFRHIIVGTDETLSMGNRSLRKNDSWEVRYSSCLLPADSVIIDRKEAFVPLSSLEKSTANYLRSTAPSIVAMAHNYFQTVWQESKPQQIALEARMLNR